MMETWRKINKFHFSAITLGLLAVFLFAYILGHNTPKPTTQQEEVVVGANLIEARWEPSISQFQGFQTKADPSKIQSGANPNGQNTIINDGDRISIRKFGADLVGDFSSSTNKITSLHTFRKRNGEQILMRSHSTFIDVLDENSDTWQSIKMDAATNTKHSFVDFNINTDQSSYVYWGNAEDSMGRWNGRYTYLNGALAGGEATITVDDTSEFASTGAIVLCSTRVTYTGKTPTTFTGVTGTPACDDDTYVANAPTNVTGAPRGNILIAFTNRLFVSGITSTTQAVYFSRYGDQEDFVGADLVTEATADAPGIFNLTEGGGAVVGMAHDEGAMYILKNNIIYKVTLTDALYTLQTLKPFDGKSQTTGGISSDTVFTGGNGVFFVTPDNEIMNLSRIDGVDYPQIIPISDVIKPTTDGMVFSTSSAGIYWKDNAYIAAQTDAESLTEDVVLLYNQRRRAWESPIVGWQPSAFTIYDNGDGTGNTLYWGSAAEANVYRISDVATDNSLGVQANWRSARYDMGAPYALKELDSFYVEGYITENTELTISLLFDEDGFTQTYTTDFAGTETDYIFDAEPLNLFGLHKFGYVQFGSSDESGKRKFRLYLNKNLRRVPFYNVQAEFASDGVAQDWEITHYAFHWRYATQSERRTLYREFN